MLSPIFTIFIVIFTLFITIYCRSKYELTHFKNINVKINSDKINDNYSFLYLTDLHEKEYGPDNTKLIDFIDKNINNIVIGGDFITFTKRKNKDNKYYINNTINFINTISKNKAIYYAFGNHELRLKYKKDDNEILTNAYNKFYNTLIDNHITILDNNYVDIDNNIRIYGISLNNRYYKKRKNKDIDYTAHIKDDIAKYIKALDTNKYNICLLHNPDFAELLIDVGFDLVLSGHHHGGMIRLPIVGSIISPDFKLMPKYSKGLYHYKGKDIIVSAGLGEHTFKIRLNNICELYTITINKENGTNTI